MHLPKISDLTLVLTERCNMNCAFCYVPKRARTMPTDLALEAVDWLVDQAPKGSRPSIGFFGGEPLLAADLLNEVVAHGRRRRGDDIRFTMPTNGTLVDKEVADDLERGGSRWPSAWMTRRPRRAMGRSIPSGESKRT